MRYQVFKDEYMNTNYIKSEYQFNLFTDLILSSFNCIFKLFSGWNKENNLISQSNENWWELLLINYFNFSRFFNNLKRIFKTIKSYQKSQNY
jgi:uncharacterized membrane protein